MPEGKKSHLPKKAPRGVKVKTCSAQEWVPLARGTGELCHVHKSDRGSMEGPNIDLGKARTEQVT